MPTKDTGLVLPHTTLPRLEMHLVQQLKFILPQCLVWINSIMVYLLWQKMLQLLPPLLPAQDGSLEHPEVLYNQQYCHLNTMQ